MEVVVIFPDFKPAGELPPNRFACSLSQRAYPVDCRTPPLLTQLLKRLERR